MDDIASALATITATLKSIDEKIGGIEKELEKMESRMSLTTEELISHRKDLEMYESKISGNYKSLKEFKNTIYNKLRELKQEAVTEAVSKVKFWFVSAVIPGAVSLLVIILPKLLAILR